MYINIFCIHWSTPGIVKDAHPPPDPPGGALNSAQNGEIPQESP